jgi:glycosyltransferase involved in cell wall biosynthesis
MRILEISPYNFAAGGSDRYFLEISLLLERDGHTVFRFCKDDPRNDPDPHQDFFPKGIDTSGKAGLGDVARMLYNRKAAEKLDAYLHVHPVDIAHLHIYYGHFSGAILKVLRTHGVPLVQTVHDYKAICPIYSCNRHGAICEDCRGKHFWKATANRCNRGSLARSALSSVETYVTDYLGARSAFDRYIAVAHFQAERLIANGVPADKMTVLHNFVDQSKYAMVPPETKADAIVYFGRIEASKGIENLVNAFLAVPEEIRGTTRLKLAGTGEGVEALKAQIAASGTQSVEYLGYVAGDDLTALIHSGLCTVLVPNVYENCSMSVLESQAMGVPVIAGDIAALPELIAPGRDGYLVPPGDRAALTKALTDVMSDPNRARAMGIEAAAKIDRDFNATDHKNKILEIFEQTIAQNHP